MIQILIYGTPGIGKTMYLQIFMVYLSRLAKEKGQDTPSIHYNFRIEDMVTTYSFFPDGSVIDISKNGENTGITTSSPFPSVSLIRFRKLL